MPTELYVSLFSTLISFAGWLLVVAQLRQGNDQRRLESLLHIKEINRAILTLGFDKPELFQVLHGKKTDSIQAVHYLQLWFNQFEMIHSFHEQGMFSHDLMESLKRDIRDFLSQGNVEAHWQKKREFYSTSFQAFIDSLASEYVGAPSERPRRKRRLKR